MAFCKKCGNPYEDGATVCPTCGAAVDGQPGDPSVNQTRTAVQPDDEAADIAATKSIAWLAYIPWMPLFLIPLFVKKQSKFSRFHVRQGATVWAIYFVWSLIHSFFVAIFGAICMATNGHTAAIVFTVLVNMFFGAIEMAIGVFAVIGVIKTLQGQKFDLPLISKIPFVAKLIDLIYEKLGVDISGD